jgi:hypothetical protein
MSTEKESEYIPEAIYIPDVVIVDATKNTRIILRGKDRDRETNVSEVLTGVEFYRDNSGHTTYSSKTQKK